MVKIKFNISEVEKWIITWLGLMIAISLILLSFFTFEEIWHLNSTNPMWMVHISGGLAFVITCVLGRISGIINRRANEDETNGI